MDLLTLELELALEQLGLRPHRDVLAGRHRERPAEEPGQAREPHDSGRWVRAREPEDQGDVRHEAVTDAEHGRPRTASVNVAMVVLVDGAITSGGADGALAERGWIGGRRMGPRLQSARNAAKHRQIFPTGAAFARGHTPTLSPTYGPPGANQPRPGGCLPVVPSPSGPRHRLGQGLSGSDVDVLDLHPDPGHPPVRHPRVAVGRGGAGALLRRGARAAWPSAWCWSCSSVRMSAGSTPRPSSPFCSCSCPQPCSPRPGVISGQDCGAGCGGRVSAPSTPPVERWWRSAACWWSSGSWPRSW